VGGLDPDPDPDLDLGLDLDPDLVLSCLHAAAPGFARHGGVQRA
jgi:hypothetical protein